MVGGGTPRSASRSPGRSHRPALRGDAIASLALLILAGAPGCTAPVLRPIDPHAPIALAPDEALLVLHVDTDVALRDLRLGDWSVAQSLPRGEQLWMIRVREGAYRWRQIEVDHQLRNRYRIDPEPEYRFEVEAGAINYPGELIVRSNAAMRSARGSLYVRNLNHSAMAVRALRKTHASILESLPIRYAGSAEDSFLAYYTRERERATARPSASDSRGASATPVAPLP